MARPTESTCSVAPGGDGYSGWDFRLWLVWNTERRALGIAVVTRCSSLL